MIDGDVLPMYDVGTKIRVLPLEEILAKCPYGNRRTPSGCLFPKDMDKYCGMEFTISRRILHQNGEDWYKLSGCPGGWTFTSEMIEGIQQYEDASGVPDLEISFDDLF